MSQTKRAYDKFLLYALLIIALGVVGFISATTVIDPNYLNTTGVLIATTLNTGQGANELYDMDQNVLQASAVTFATVDTGQGANELYDMNQNVMTSSAVTFTTLNTGQGANELFDMDQNVLTTSDVEFNSSDSAYYFLNSADVTPILGYPQQDYDYLVWVGGATTYAKNGTTGNIDYSGADSATVIQSALNGLSSGRTWKEKVVLKGDFEITAVISISSYTTLDLSDAKLTLDTLVNDHIIKNSGWDGTPASAGTTPNNDIEIIGGEIDGNKVGQTLANTKGIVLRNVTNVIIRGVYVHDVREHGISVDAGLGDLSTNIWIEDCISQDNGVVEGDGIVFNRVNNGIIRNNVASGSLFFNGIAVANGKNCLIEGNMCYGNKHGITIEAYGADNAYNHIINNNIVYDSTTYSTYLKQSATPGYFVYDTVISNNMFNGSTVVMERTVRSSFLNNEIYDSAGTGLYLNYCNDTIVTGNQIYSQATNGINVYYSNQSIVSNNKIDGTGSTQNGVRIYSGSYNVVADNILENHASLYGLELADDGVTASLYNVITGNIMKNNKRSIGESSLGNYNLIKNNIFEGNDNDPPTIVGTYTVVKENMGFVTEIRGTTTITSGSTSSAVTHGLNYTPTSFNTDWTVTYRENPTNDCGPWYITFNSTHVIIHVFRDPGASNLDLAWSARRTP